MLKLNLTRKDVGCLLDNFSRIDSTTKSTLSSVENLESSHKDSMQYLHECVEASTAAIISQYDGARLVPEELLSEIRGIRQLIERPESVEKLSSDALTSQKSLNENFLETLKFPGMDDREDAIPDTHVRTCEWILADSEVETLGSQCQYKYERRELKEHVMSQLRSLGLDADEEMRAFKPQTTSDQPTGHLQEWLRSGRGVL